MNALNRIQHRLSFALLRIHVREPFHFFELPHCLLLGIILLCDEILYILLRFDGACMKSKTELGSAKQRTMVSYTQTKRG
jgi:hypothetical protein